MNDGRIIVAHRNSKVRAALAEGLAARGLVCMLARQAAEVALMQASMRSHAVLVGMDWAKGELMSALRRDVIHPYVLVSSGRISGRDDRSMRRLGVSELVCEEEPEHICDLIERYLAHRLQRERDGETALCSAVRRVLSEYGLPCHLSGYRCLMLAAQLLSSGEASLKNLGDVYGRASERFGCSVSAVERSMRQAVKLCALRSGREELGSVRAFLSCLMEETEHMPSLPLIQPRVAIFSEDERRVF